MPADVNTNADSEKTVFLPRFHRMIVWAFFPRAARQMGICEGLADMGLSFISSQSRWMNFVFRKSFPGKDLLILSQTALAATPALLGGCK